jgi:hypothetical protein
MNRFIPSFSFLSIAIAIVCGLVGCAETTTSLTDVDLVWSGYSSPERIGAGLTKWVDAKIAIAPFTDRRTDPTTIGQYAEEALPPRVVTTRTNVAAFCTQSFTKELTMHGLTVVTADPSVTLGGEVLQFSVAEAATYRANVSFKIVAKDPQGAVLWEGIASGTANRWGRSFSEANFMEALTSAFDDAVNKMLEQPGFDGALGGAPEAK